MINQKIIHSRSSCLWLSFLKKAVLSILILVSLVNSSFCQDYQEYLDAARKNSRNPDSLAYYGQLLLQETDSLALLEGYFAVGYSFYQKGSIERAVLYYDSALSFTNRDKLANTYDRIIRNQGIAYQRMGNTGKAREIYNIMLSNAEADENPVAKALALNQIGLIEQLDGNYNKSAQSLNEALDLFKKYSPEGMINTFLNLGTLYGRMDLIDKSNQMLKEAAKTAEDFNQPVLAARCYNNISVNYRKVSKTDSSNIFLRKSLAIYQSNNNSLGLVTTYQNLSLNFLEDQQADSCFHYLKLARELNDPGEDLFLEGELDFLEAQAELRFNGNIQRAIDLVNISITKALQQNRIDDTRDRYEFLSEAYEKAGQDKLALQILRKWKNLNDSLEYYKNIGTIGEITEKFDLARSEILIESQETKTNLTRNLIIVSILTLMALSAAVWYYNNYKKERSEKIVKESEIEDLKDKLKQLSQTKSRHRIPREFITLKSKALLKLDDIKYIQSDGPYIEIFLEGKEKPEIDRNSLKGILEELPPEGFIQVHRSYIVNIEFIKAFYSTKIVLVDGTEVNVSRSFKEEVESYLKATA